MTRVYRDLQRAAVFFLLLVSGCAPALASTAPPFIPPAAQPLPSDTPLPPPTILVQSPTVAPTVPAVSPSEAPSPTAGPCTDDLDFSQDLTVPDGSVIPPGASIDKQWLVTNSGTCDWDSSYRLRFVGGDPLGADAEQALYPARAGTQATLRILFTAPAAAGTYQSAWQAISPEGTAFGDAIYITVNVSP